MKPLSVILLLALLLAVVITVEILLARRGEWLEFENPSHEPLRFGQGDPLTYVVIGDSTSAGEGGDYESGIAVKTARHLAQNRSVALYNFSVSGATIHDVLTAQLPLAASRNPEVVLVAAGANDVTRLTARAKVSRQLTEVITGLKTANPQAAIVLTGSADMGSIPRFAQPLRFIAGLRTRQLNRTIQQVAGEQQVVFAPIARETGPLFRADPALFAVDKFHPNNRGYATWLPVLYKALDEALKASKEHVF